MPVKVTGVKETLKALRKVQPEAAKAVSKEVRAAARPVVSKAKGYAPSQAPLSGWGKAEGLWANRVYSGSQVKSKIGFGTSPTKPNRSGFSYTAYIYNKSVAGAIYETAGRKNPNGQPSQASTKGKYSSYIDTSSKVNKSANPNAGKQFIDSMGELYKAQRVQGQRGRTSRKMNGRLIFRAFGEDNGKMLGAVAQAYDKVARNFNQGKY